MTFWTILQKCKTLHVRYRRKVERCHFDDELLEAYVAVGGHADTSGAIDLKAIRSVARDFNLTIHLGDEDGDGDAAVGGGGAGRGATGSPRHAAGGGGRGRRPTMS